VKQCTPEVEIYLTRSVPPENLKTAIAVAKEFEWESSRIRCKMTSLLKDLWQIIMGLHRIKNFK